MATDDKYDRQVRLWGDGGQRQLQRAEVVCFGSSATMTEAAKNLILPGVGKLTMVDDCFVDPEVDPKVNFFVPADALLGLLDDDEDVEMGDAGARGEERELLTRGDSAEDLAAKTVLVTTSTLGSGTSASSGSSSSTGSSRTGTQHACGRLSRSEVAAKYLQRLNPDCSVVGLHMGPLGAGSAQLEQAAATATLMIVDEAFKEKVARKTVPGSANVAALLQRKFDAVEDGVPIIECCSRGFVGYVKLCKKTPHIVVDAKADGDQQLVKQQLRLAQPFPELLAHAGILKDRTEDATARTGSSSSWGKCSPSSSRPFSPEARAGTATASYPPDLSDISDSAEHAHIPYPVILLHAAEKHGKQLLEQSRESKEAFKKTIAGMRRSVDEQNFQEALTLSYLLHDGGGRQTLVPDDTRDALACMAETGDLAAKAVLEFCDKHRHLPLPGGVPDMTASTECYLKLQNVYRRRAEVEVRECGEILDRLLVGTSSGPEATQQDLRSRLAKLCQNAFSLRKVDLLTRWNVLGNAKEGSADSNTFLTEEALQELFFGIPEPELPEAEGDEGEVADPEEEKRDKMTLVESLIPWYVGIHTVLHESGNWGKVKGDLLKKMQEAQGTDNMEDHETAPGDKIELPAHIDELIGQFVIPEVQRCAGDLHTTAAFLGGVVAQEAIKLVTKTHVPLANTLVYCGVSGRAEVMELV
eukprot:g8804.t1